MESLINIEESFRSGNKNMKSKVRELGVMQTATS